MTEKFLTTEQVAEILSMSSRQVREHVKNGHLKAVKVGNQLRILETEIQKLKEAAR